jgi:succinate dehydrogenase/fumarate reductase flavoprotein subunit
LTDESGAVFEDSGSVSWARALAAIADGRRVYASWCDADAARVPLRAVLQGTVRGAGGVRLSGFDCATTVPGLFGAGEVTAREPITGAVAGFDGHGGAWAMASGSWAGTSAAGFARGRGRLGPVRAVAGAGLHPEPGIDPRAVIGLVQEHTLPLRRSYWRSAGSLRDSIGELDAIWPATEFDLGGAGPSRVHAREAAALLAVARWTKYSALARTESRGVHRRTDYPAVGESWCRTVLTGGLESVWVRARQCESVESVSAQSPDLAPA